MTSTSLDSKQLRQFVIDELELEPSLDATGIGVTAEHGVVSLSGHVADYAQKMAAERATWQVKGVKGVAQDIDVRLVGDRRSSDDEIAQRALNILAWSTLVPHDRIHVRVSDGWLTLSGYVDWNFQRQAAASEMRKLSGVVGVSNDIEIKPAAQTGDVRQRIVDALTRHAEIEAGHITIDVRDGGVVHLDGHVDSWEERRAVERAVWSAAGVHAVEDRLSIN